MLTVPCAARIIIVDDDGWADFTTVQPAIDDSNDGDVIVLFPGIYSGIGNKNIDFKGKAVTVRSVWPEDDYIVAATVIDCEHAGRGFYFHSGEDANSVIDGLTITNGSQAGGSGICCINSSPTIAYCIITGNSASIGGGVDCYTSNPTITNCNISKNTATDGSGGGIHCYNSNPTVTNCIISDNTANSGGPTPAGGGGIWCGQSTGQFKNCVISANSAELFGGGFCCDSYSYPTVTCCTFTGNSASNGGGMFSSQFSSQNQVMVTSCIFNGNRAGYRGGAIAGSGTWTNCTISANSASDSGGAIAGWVTLTNCTLSSNSANNSGGGIFCVSNPASTLVNCILWANSVGGVINQSTQIAGITPLVTFSCIQDNDPNDGSIPFGGTANGNIDDNPMFVRDPNDGGDGWGTGNNDDFGDLHLKTDSPCINTGAPYFFAKGQTDIDYQPRIMGRRVDMGADEFLIKLVVVTKPQGNEIWAAGSIHNIVWESDIYAGDVDVLFSQDAGNNWQTFKTAIPCTGIDLWQLPNDVDSNQCVLSVVPSIPDANVVCIHSGLFTIQPYSPGPAVDARWKTLGGDFKRTGLSENFGPEFGCVLWQFKTPGDVPTSVTVGLDDRVHIACEDGKLYTLDPNGSLLWSYDANSPLTSSPTIGPDGSIYVGSANGKLHAISPDGSIRWTHNTDGPIYSSPAVSADGEIYVCSQDGILYALSQDGSELWSFQTDGPAKLSGSIFASPAIGTDGTVYIGALYDPNLYALDPNDGTVKWVCNFDDPCKPDGKKEGGWPFASPVVAADGTIYQTLLYDSNLYAIEPNDGAVIWKTNLADPLSGWFDPNYAKDYGDADGWSEPALGPDGTIYVSFDDPYLRAVEPNGSIKWIMPLGTSGGFTLTVGSDGLIYAACDANLYVVDVNGWEIARFQSKDLLNYPVIARDNVIILTDANDASLLITDTNNTVWAISRNGCRDLNFDGVINLNDIALLAEYWLECTDVNWPCNYQGEQIYLTADVDADRYVGFSDLALIANLWLGSEKLLKLSPQPEPASNPSPPNGSTNVLPTLTYLSWTAGSYAVWHNVYFGTANPPPFVGSQTYTTFNPGQLTLATTYYWRIDEVNPMGTTTGELWRFTTRGKMIVCFPADTLVWVDGATVPISKATPGQSAGKLNCALVTSGLKQIEKVEEHQGTFQCYDIALENGDYISVADSHCFMLDCGQWAAVQDLRAGLKLKSLNGPVSIKNVTKRQTHLTGKVYNLKVKDSDRYFVGKDGIIVCDY